METFGYYGRFWLAQQPDNFKAYILYDLLVLPAPIFFAATLYMSLGRIIEWLDAAEFSPTRPRRMSRLFVTFDVLCFLVQMAGIGMGVTTSVKIQNIGAKVIVVGLVLQILVFALFLWATAAFLTRCKAQQGSDSLHWKRYILTLLAASGCIMLRNIVRGIEHAQGTGGYVASHEAFIYIFDALPMFVVVALFAAFQPGGLKMTVRRVNLGAEAGIGMKAAGSTDQLVSENIPAPVTQKEANARPGAYSYCFGDAARGT